MTLNLPGLDLIDDPDVLASLGHDEAEWAPAGKAIAAVRPRTTEDVRRVVAACAQRDIPIVPRGAGTGLSGGANAVDGCLILDLSRMSQILEIDADNMIAVVQPGVVNDDLKAAVAAHGLWYPPDPASSPWSTIGGNVSTNAGGLCCLKYGVTRDYVLGLEAILMGGTRIRTGRRTAKGVTGYDVTALLTGSEGTLAVFSEATLRLIPKPPEVATLLALFVDVRAAAEAVAAIVALGLVPRCLELLDKSTLAAVRARGVSVDERAGAMLIIEVDGDAHACEQGTERIGEACTQASALDVLVAQDASQRSRLWAARREMSPAVRALARHKISEDVVVPRRSIAPLLDGVERTSQETGIRSLTYGHAGDGNLHVNFLWNEPDDVPKVERCIVQLFRDVVSFGGTLSGEHGIGLLKAPYLGLEQSDALIDLQMKIKRTFDPKGLLNPGKKR
jgi:glycolate oxidase